MTEYIFLFPSHDRGRDELMYAIGRDASKDWECLDIKEIKDE